MSVIAAALRELIAAGVTGDARNAALRLEHSLIVTLRALVNKDRRKYQMWEAA